LYHKISFISTLSSDKALTPAALLSLLLRLLLLLASGPPGSSDLQHEGLDAAEV
jgi:hypothetical protein